MRKLNFEQPTPISRDVGGAPSWMLMVFGALLVGMFYILAV